MKYAIGVNDVICNLPEQHFVVRL
jgi:hypothetical protein